MAEYNGTGGSNTYGGTSENDLINGLGGNDDLAGAGGNDTIIGGDGADTLAGGAGNDYFGFEEPVNINNFAEIDGDDVDGGADIDTMGLFIVNPTTTIPFSVTTSGGGTISDGSAFSADVRNVEFIEVLNSGEILTPGTASYLTLSNMIVGNPASSSSEATIDPEYYDGTTVTANAFSADGSAGLMVDGALLSSGDTFDTNMGEVTTRYYSSSGGYWTFELIYPDELFYAIGYADEFIIDQISDVKFTEQGGDEYTTPLKFGYYLDKDVYASAATESLIFSGDDQDSYIELGNFRDFVNGGDGDDTIYAGGGDDQIFAGAGDTGADLLYGEGGNDILGGAAGADIIFGGIGSDTIFGGDDADQLYGEENADTIWSGRGNDLTFGGSGNDELGGGEGADDINGGDGNDTMYASDGDDVVVGDAGDDEMFGGDGNDLLEGREGDDLIYNGANGPKDPTATDQGGDSVYGGAGNDTIWGGAGDDDLYGETGQDEFAFTASTGNDVVHDFELTGPGPYTGDVLDLREFVQAQSDPASYTTNTILSNMSDTGGDTLLFLSAGNTITFTGLSVSDFQSATDDWVLLF